MSTVDRITCSTTPRMTLWRINRYEVIADVEVSIRADTWSGDDVECDINTFNATLNCCLDEEFSYSIDIISHGRYVDRVAYGYLKEDWEK